MKNTYAHFKGIWTFLSALEEHIYVVHSIKSHLIPNLSTL